MELIKIGIIETAPVPNPFGRVGSACTLSFGAIWKPVDYAVSYTHLREELLKRVWGENYLGESRTVDVHIGQLRKKLELYDEIRTIPKLGYRLEE